MSEPLKISYEYSYPDLKESIRQHLRHRVRKTARVLGGIFCLLGWAVWIFLVLLLRSQDRELDLDIFLFPVILTVLSMVFLLLNPALVARLQKRRFKHMFGETHSWGFSPEGYEVAIGDRAQGSGKWGNFTRAVRTSSGLLLYHPSGVFNWLPTRAFGEAQQIDTLLAWASAKGLKIVRRR